MARTNQLAPSISVTVKVDQNSLGFRIPNLSDILTFVIRLFFVIAGLVALVYLLLGAFAWITSGGDEENTGKARNKITAAIVGVVLVVAVLAIIVTLEQVVFRERICFGISCAATIPNLVEPCGPDVGIDCDTNP
jgi:amino acid transporter